MDGLYDAAIAIPAVRIGVAGWSIPAALRARFPDEGTHLERYAARFNAVEINSSFYRPHRRETYARWAASVPPGFRFAVKLPRAITHERGLVDCEAPLDRFVGEVAGLGDARGPLLVQLPPSLRFHDVVAERFFALLIATAGGPIVCEPRHASWFSAAADALLVAHRIARVVADPARVAGADRPGGWAGLAYFRLHGTPRIYWSSYEPLAIAAQAAAIAALLANGDEVWTIYDNTAAGAAVDNAFALLADHGTTLMVAGAARPRS